MESQQRQWLEAAQEGDMDAFSYLFEELRPSVYAISYRIVGGNDAEDIVTEVFLKAWKSLPKFNQQSAIKTWFYRITYNSAIDFIRQKKRSKLVLEEDVLEKKKENISSHLQPNTQMIRSETKQMVCQAMKTLNTKYRTTLWLRYADGLSYKDIAVATGVGIGTVMSRLFHGKRKLRKLLLVLER